MPTKTISLELDAYEKLRRAKRTPRESFSSVVRRMRIEEEIATGESLLQRSRAMLTDHHRVSKNTIRDWEKAQAERRISPSEWESKE